MRPVLIALAAALVGAGCGETEATRPTPPDFFREADAICREYEARLEELPEPETIADLEALAEQAVPIAREAIERLRALEPPPEAAADVERWLERNDENLRLLQRLRVAARAGDETRVQRIASEAAENEREADALARDLGLRDCAEEGGVRPAG